MEERERVERERDNKREEREVPDLEQGGGAEDLGLIILY